jgi:hypothetical protein
VIEELGVEERRRPFFAHWVRQFFNRQQEQKQRRDLGREEIEAFIQTLAAEPSVADWQIVQARNALVEMAIFFCWRRLLRRPG